MKRALALIMAAMIVSLSVMNTYKITAEAAVMPPAVVGPAVYETFSTIFGHSMGFGKSTEGMNQNISSDKLNTLLNNLSNYMDMDFETKRFVGTGLAIEAFLEMLRLTGNDLDTLTGSDDIRMMKLEERAYSAYKVSFVKSAKDRLDEILAKVESMDEAEFQKHLQELQAALDESSDFDGTFTDASIVRAIFDGLNIASINYSSSYDSAWVQPVAGSVNRFTDVLATKFTNEGVDYPIYVTNYFTKYDSSMKETYNIVSDKLFCVLPVYFKLSGLMNYFIASDAAFTVTIRRIKNNVVQETTNISSTKHSSGCYYVQLNMSKVDTMSFSYKTVTTNALIAALPDRFYNYYYNVLLGVNPMYNNMESMKEASPAVDMALDALDEKATTTNDFAAVADSLTESAEPDAGTAEALRQLADVIAGITTTFPDTVVDGKNDVVKAVEDVGEAILTLPKGIALELEGVLDAIRVNTQIANRPWEDGENKDNSFDIVDIFNGIILLLMIVFTLLKIFLHCMMFIINIFRIPAQPAFLPDEMIMGLQYLNSLEIPGIGMSVYSFMMGLIYIMIMFYAIGVLRKSVDRIKLPKQK